MEISIHQEEGFVSVKLAGAINEDNDLSEYLDQIEGSVVAIDLSEVNRINSCGVRDWVNWISALEAKGSEMFFLECSPSIVAQINLVNNFTGHGRIKSLYLPYFCESCNTEDSVLYEAEDLATPDQLPPASRCNGCEQFMDFDDMPDAYFAFLSNRDRLALGDTGGANVFALPKKGIRQSAQTLAHGSTSLPDINELLEATIGGEVPASTDEESTIVEPSKPAARAASGSRVVIYVSLALLLAGGTAIVLQLS